MRGAAICCVALSSRSEHFAIGAAPRIRNELLPCPGESLLIAANSGKTLPQAADRALRGARRIQSLLDDLLD